MKDVCRNDLARVGSGPIAGMLAAIAAFLVLAATAHATRPPIPKPPPVIRTLTPIASGAEEKVEMKAGFEPYRLGASTTVAFSFEIHSPPKTVPQPLIGIDLSLPRGLGVSASGLGLATCDSRTIFEAGLQGCPPNSLVGRGSATATVPIGPAILRERVQIALLATASQGSNAEILYGAEGLTPVFAQLVFRGEILEGIPPYGPQIDTFIPPIETLPEAPYAAVVAMSSTIGPSHITYYRRSHGRRTPFQPRGLELPRRCPRSGFRFAATFTFLDQAVKTIRHRLACPASKAASRPPR